MKKNLLILIILITLIGCSKEKENKSITEKEIFEDKMTGQKYDMPIKYELWNYIYDKKLFEKYDFVYPYEITRDLMFIELRKDSIKDNFLIRRYYNLKDSISVIDSSPTNLTIEDAIKGNLIYKLQKAISDIPKE